MAKNKLPLNKLINIVYELCLAFTGVKFYPYQEQFAKAIIRAVLSHDGESITALFSRQSGKTFTVAAISAGLMAILPRLACMPMFEDDDRLKMYQRGFWVGIFAPILRQASIPYDRIRDMVAYGIRKLDTLDPDYQLSFKVSNGQNVLLSNGSRASAIPASPNSNIEGETFMLVICDECQDIPDLKISKSIIPMTAAFNASLIKIGTPGIRINNFYDSIELNKANEKEHPNAPKCHFEFNAEVAAKYNPLYARHVEVQKRDLGENSQYFRMSYMLEWFIGQGMMIDKDDFIRGNSEPFLERNNHNLTDTCVAGIDVGGSNDSTVITIAQVDWNMPVVLESRVDDEGVEMLYSAYNVYIIDWLELSDMKNLEEQYSVILKYLNNFNIQRVLIDATRERGLSDRIAANVDYQVVPFIFTLKNKSDLYKHLDKEISARRVRFCYSEQARKTKECEKFLLQLSELEKEYNGSVLRVRHGTRRNSHDDYCDSLALAVYAASSEGEENTAEATDNVFLSQTNSDIEFYNSRNRLTAG